MKKKLPGILLLPVTLNWFLPVKARGPDFAFRQGQAKAEKISLSGSPLSVVRELMKDYRAVDVPGLPRFYGGMVGYLSYDCVRFFERLPDKTADDLKLA